MGYKDVECVYIGCAANKTEEAYEIRNTGLVDTPKSPLRRLAQRLALVYDAIVMGEVASHGVEFPNIQNDDLMGVRYGAANDHAYLVGQDFQVSFTEASSAVFVEDRLRIGFKGRASSIRNWLHIVEGIYLPKGKNLPKVFWPSEPDNDWETTTLADGEAIERFEHAAVANAVLPWGYRTKRDADDREERTYYFRDTADAVYARFMA